MDCPSCGRANTADRVECSHCEALLVDVFGSNDEGKTDPIVAIGRDLSVPGAEESTDTTNGFTRFSTETQYSGDLPRLFRFGNRYQVLEKLGEGGMGRVYKALDLELDRPVALKTIRTEKGRGPEVLKRFKQELVLARKITHKNVVRIYDLGEAEGGLKFFTMELVEGKSLRDLLQEKKTIPTREAISFMKQMLSGLAEAHSQGVVHRDLKPQNIMIDGDGVLRIMDFGIARTADTATLTGSGEMMGTPDYISPEQVKGETTTAASDLYSAGIILYEILTGEVPFKGDTAISKVVARLQVKPAPPRTLNPEIPPYLERIVLKLMEVDPELRYKTAEEVLQDLEREQVDSSFFLRTRKAILRRKGLIAAVLAGSAGVGGWLLSTKPAGQVQAAPVTTLAILPFHNMAGNSELAWMESGVPEMLAADISQSASLRPVREDRIRRILEETGKSGQTDFDDATLDALSNMAGADYVLHGRFLESEGKLRIDLILKETTTGVGTPMKLEVKAREVFTLVDALTDRISEELDLDTVFSRNRPISEIATSSIDAFRAYQSGIGHLQGGRNQAAVEALQEAVQIDAKFAIAHARLAEAHWNLGDSASAKVVIENASRLALDQPLPLSERFQIHAISARINDDPGTAVDAYRKLSEFYPSDPDVLLGLASALESKGEMDEALETYRAVIAANPTYGAALLGLGRILVILDRHEEAISFLEKAVETGEFEDDLERLGMLHSVLGVAYRTSTNYAQALEHFELSLAAREKADDRRGVIATLVHIGATRKELRQMERATETLNQAIDLARKQNIQSLEAFALQNLGNLALESGQLDAALEHYRASLDIEWDRKENNEIAYRLDAMAEVYRLSGRYVDALVFLEQARTRLEGIDEPSERAFNQSILGQVLRARGLYNEAIEALLNALPPLAQSEQRRDLASARRALADIYMDQGRFDEALKIINQSLSDFEEERGGNLATAKAQYAEFLMRVGDYPAATTELSEIASLMPDPEFEGRLYYDYLRGALLGASLDPNATSYLIHVRDQAKGRDVLLSDRAGVAHGLFLLRRGQLASARTQLETSLREARRLNHRVIHAEAALALAELENLEGDLPAAEAMLEEAEAIAASYQGRVLLAQVSTKRFVIARERGEREKTEEAIREANQLFQWIVARLPPKHADSFETTLGISSLRADAPVVRQGTTP